MPICQLWYLQNFGSLANQKNNNNPFFGYFSISSEILTRFELTLFTIFIIFTDNRRARCAGGLKKRAIWLPETGNAGKAINLNFWRSACSETKTGSVSIIWKKFQGLVAMTTVFIAAATVFIWMATVFVWYGDRLHGDKVPGKWNKGWLSGNRPPEKR